GDNNYIGQTFINAGTLIAAGNNALGTATDGQGTVVNNGGTLGLQGTALSIAEKLTIAGGGAANRSGAIENLGGGNTLTSPITANAISTIASSAPSPGLLTIADDVNLQGGKINFDGSGDILVNGDITALPGSGGYAQIINADDPLLYWRLGENSKSAGQLANNSASGPSSLGSAGNGTYRNTVGNVSDAQVAGDTAASFGTTTATGTTGDRVELGGMTAFPTVAITAEAWVRGTGGTDPTIFSFVEDGGSNNEFLLIEQSNTWRIFVNNGSTNTGVARDAILDGNWHHVVASWDTVSDRTRLYVDGALAGSAARSTSAIGAAGSFIIAQEQDSLLGGFANNQRFVGDLDEVAIYNTVLSDSTIASHYDAGFGAAGNGTGLMKSGSGTVTLAGNNNYDGEATVMAGVLVAASDTALGTDDGNTTVASGATLRLSGGVNVASESLTLGSSAAGNPGTLESGGGNNIYAGPITAETAVTGEIQIVSSAAGGKLSITGDISLQQSKLTVDGAGDTAISGQIVGGGDIFDPTYSDAVLALPGVEGYWKFETIDGGNGTP
ncbi:MAG: LamG-like jellyroll fold domain-containing protein, partial [Planctomycetota bacterium]|nr:LamG-like jellyroll fold domain-containing protein [Planctomycetota bacterium]